MRACQPKESKRREWRSVQERERESEREGERERKSAHSRERKRERESALAPPLICSFLQLGLPYANWA